MRQFVADDSFYEEGWKAGKFLIFDERVWGRFFYLKLMDSGRFHGMGFYQESRIIS